MESGITLNYLDVVIDTGYELSVRFNPYLKCEVINKYDTTPKDKITQRSGRVGRIAGRSGVVIRCYTEKYYEDCVPEHQGSQLSIAQNYEKYYINNISLRSRDPSFTFFSHK